MPFMKTAALNITVAIFLIIFAGIPTQSFAQLYKWRDKNGAIHYADTPPPNSSYKSKSIHDAPQPDLADQISAEKRLEEDKQSIEALRERMRYLKRQEAEQASPANQLNASIAQFCMQQINKLQTGNFTGLPDLSSCWNTSAASSLSQLCAEKINNGSWNPPPFFCTPHSQPIQSPPPAIPLTPTTGGAIDPSTGAFYPDVGGGYINPKNGEFYPK